MLTSGEPIKAQTKCICDWFLNSLNENFSKNRTNLSFFALGLGIHSCFKSHERDEDLRMQRDILEQYIPCPVPETINDQDTEALLKTLIGNVSLH